MIFPFKIAKRSLGMDIGAYSIKVIELSKFGKRVKLENYAEVLAPEKRPFRTFDATAPLISSAEIAKVIKSVLEEAKIETKRAILTIPDYSSFFTWFDLPPMNREEIPEAVKYEARQHIPFPLSEVTLDWQIIGTEKEDGKIKILLVTVPNELVEQYAGIATLCQLELIALEAEVFALSRSSVTEKNKTIALVDIGARSTTCSIIDNGILKRSYSFDVSGSELTQIVSKALNTDYLEAQELKKSHGLLSQEKSLREILLPIIDLVLVEIKKVIENFYQAEAKGIQKVILGGGTALLPGLREYFEESLKKEVKIANPFFNIFYPPILGKTLSKIGPSYAIAVGAALRGVE